MVAGIILFLTFSAAFGLAAEFKANSLVTEGNKSEKDIRLMLPIKMLSDHFQM